MTVTLLGNILPTRVSESWYFIHINSQQHYWVIKSFSLSFYDPIPINIKNLEYMKSDQKDYSIFFLILNFKLQCMHSWVTYMIKWWILNLKTSSRLCSFNHLHTHQTIPQNGKRFEDVEDITRNTMVQLLTISKKEF